MASDITIRGLLVGRGRRGYPENMLFGGVISLVTLIVSIGLILLSVWAVVDCARRPANLFPYIERQSKTLWLILTALAIAAAILGGVIFWIISAVISLVYLFDLRPKFEQVGNRSY